MSNSTETVADVLNTLSDIKRQFYISALEELEHAEGHRPELHMADFKDKIQLYDELMEDVKDDVYFQNKHADAAKCILTTLKILYNRMRFIDVKITELSIDINNGAEDDDFVKCVTYMKDQYPKQMELYVYILKLIFVSVCAVNNREQLDAKLEPYLINTLQTINNMIKTELEEDSEINTEA